MLVLPCRTVVRYNLCPTQCDYDYPLVISALKESHFQGVLAFEYRPTPPADAAKAGYHYMRKLLDAEGQNADFITLAGGLTNLP